MRTVQTARRKQPSELHTNSNLTTIRQQKSRKLLSLSVGENSRCVARYEPLSRGLPVLNNDLASLKQRK